MKRRDFVNTTMIIGATTPYLSFLGLQPVLDFEEITGQKDPELFGKGYRLRKEASEAFAEMKSAAAKVKIDLFSVSSYRSFNDQKRIWNNKYQRFTRAGDSPKAAIARIIEYSTIPGTSRHHWGTDIDIVDGNKDVQGDRLLPGLFQKGQPYEELKVWLDENATGYGFYEVYTNKPGRKGFKYEPWHLTYEPMSKGILKQYMEIDFGGLLRKLTIDGNKHFDNSFIDRYWKENMMDINPSLIPS